MLDSRGHDNEAFCISQRLSKAKAVCTDVLAFCMAPTGKRTMLNYLEGLSEKVQVFYTRLRLSQDPQAQSYLSSLQATMLERQATWEGFFRS